MSSTRTLGCIAISVAAASSAAVVVAAVAYFFFPLYLTIDPSFYASALASGRADVAPVRELEALFPGGEHFISYYNGVVAPPVWNSVVAIHGRYELTLQLPIELDTLRRHVVSHGKPTYVLLEVAQVSATGDRSFVGSSERHFGAREWEKLRDSGGELAVLGLAIVADQPVPGFGGTPPDPDAPEELTIVAESLPEPEEPQAPLRPGRP